MGVVQCTKFKASKFLELCKYKICRIIKEEKCSEPSEMHLVI